MSERAFSVNSSEKLTKLCTNGLDVTGNPNVVNATVKCTLETVDTAKSPENTPLASSNWSGGKKSSGLAKEARIGIGVGIGLGAALVAIALAFIFVKKHRRKSAGDPKLARYDTDYCWNPPVSQLDGSGTAVSQLDGGDRHELSQPPAQLSANGAFRELPARHGKTELSACNDPSDASPTTSIRRIPPNDREKSMA